MMHRHLRRAGIGAALVLVLLAVAAAWLRLHARHRRRAAAGDAVTRPSRRIDDPSTCGAAAWHAR